MIWIATCATVAAQNATGATAAPVAAGKALAACGTPPAVLKLMQPNIFTEQQEQWLGDAMSDMIERYYKPVKDPAENAYLARIAQRLLGALPPTTIQFKVLLVDSPEVNGFSIAGGHVYLTRKLVANAKNEDEVASVIGHEMGHILSHQFAIETTANMKRLLGVTSVGDKADIYAKFERLVDAEMKDKHPAKDGNSDEGQDEADVVAVYATAAAGYRPQAYAEFWDRMFFIDGKLGGALSDFFGTTKPEQKRLRAIQKLVKALPAGCGAAADIDSAEFEQWRTLVVANQAVAVEANVKPVAEVELTPPLRMDLDRLRYSRDGKYILAQDESSISVLSREPYRQLFRFDAEKALPAEFSPDSQRIVFHTAGLHVEEWSVKEQKLVASHEPVAKQDCVQTKLSPDGRTLFCFSVREQDEDLVLDLAMLDTANGEVLFQKKGVMTLSYYEIYLLEIAARYGLTINLIPSSISADGNTMLVGPGSNKLSFDLRTRQPIALGGELKSGINSSYAFMGNDKVFVSMVGGFAKNPGLFSFPEGKRQQAIAFAASDLESVTGGNYVLSHDVNDYAVGLGDLAAAKFILASKTPAMDVYDGMLLNENVDGSVVMHKIGDQDRTNDPTTMLPLSPLSSSLRVSASADGRLIALGTRTRGGVWSLRNGTRVLLANHFNAAVFAPDDTVYIEFPKVGKQERSIVHFEYAPFSSTRVSYKVDDTMRLGDGMLQEWKPAEKGKKGVELIVHDVRDNSILWRRSFDGGEPAHTANVNPGSLLLSFPLKTDYAKMRLKAGGVLADQAAAIKNRDEGRLIQMLDAGNGNVLHELVLAVPGEYEGVGGINIVGDLLYLTSADNRTMVYTLATGKQVRQVFGYVVAADPVTGRVCTVNRRDEAIVYDSQGQELAHYNMGSLLRFAAFRTSAQNSGEQGSGKVGADQLVLFTADQKVRTMAIPNAARTQAVAP